MMGYIQQLRKNNVRKHGWVLLVMMVLYGSLIVTLPHFQDVIHGMGIALLTLLLISFIIQLRTIKYTLRQQKVKVTHQTHSFPYPQKFTDPLVDVGGFFKRYIHKKHLIPEYLIEFREGRMLYLYPIVTEISDETYTIMRVHKFNLALVMDEQKKKRILHLGNASLIN